MFSKKDQDKKAQQAKDTGSKAFLDDYTNLVRKHHRDFDAVVEYSEKGITARLVVIEFTPPSNIALPQGFQVDK